MVMTTVLHNNRRYVTQLLLGLAAFALLVSHVKPLYAQNDIRFERITVDQGLSQSAIRSMVQDRYGYLWVATMDGLNRYNGKEFRVYRHSHDNRSLYSNQMNTLSLDPENNLWITFDDAIAVYNPALDNFTNYKIKLPDPRKELTIREVDHLSQDILLISTNQGLFEFNRVTNQIKPSSDYSFFKDKNVSTFFISPGTGEWVFSSSGVFVRHKNSPEWIKLLSDSYNVGGYWNEAADEVYIQTRRQLLKFSEKQLRVVAKFPEGYDFDGNHYGMTKLSNGELWVFRKVIHVYDANDVYKTTLKNIPQNPGSLSGDYVSSILETKDKVVWVGTNGVGLNKYDPRLSIFKYLGTFYGAPLTLSNNFVNSVYTPDDNRVFVGTLSGLDVVDIRKDQSSHFAVVGKDGLPAQVNKIFPDRNSTIWLCTSKGMMKFDDGQVRFSGMAALDSTDLGIYGAVEVAFNSYWLSTGKGIYQWNPDRNLATKITSHGSLAIGLFNGEPWIESAHDIKILNLNSLQVERILKKNSADSTAFPNATIKCFYTDSEGLMWLGSWGGGLTLFNPDSGIFTSYSEAAGLPNSVVYGILEDAAGYLWLSTNRGISVFDKKKRRTIRNFDKDDGLQANEFNTYAYFRSPSGKFYWGGVNGLTYFNPAEAIKIHSEVPNTALSGFFINQERVDLLKDGEVINQYGNQSIVLDWHQRNFGVEVVGLGFSYPGRTKFKYMLENFDDAWNYINPETRISFTNVPPGQYTLRVLSSNSFGEWEKDGLVMEITIKGPIWKSSGFILISVVILMALGGVIYFWRVSELKKRASYLANMVTQRTREIQVKNEEIATQNEEIMSQNEELSTQSEVLANQNLELNAVRASLEEKVEDRTKALVQANHKLVEQNAQLEQFSFITAHNIRGPVARIKGLLKLLPCGDSQVATHLDTSVENLDQVISDLNTIISIRHGVGQLTELVPLKTILEQAIKSLGSDLERLDAVIDTVDFDEIAIQGIKPYFYSIFYNLLHNALKYAYTSRRPLIVCSAKKIEDKLIITVKDNGLGIDMRYAREKIFTLYQRFHAEVAGKGFGLFLIKTQVEAMGGRIDVASELNVGTTFVLTFNIHSTDK